MNLIIVIIILVHIRTLERRTVVNARSMATTAKCAYVSLKLIGSKSTHFRKNFCINKKEQLLANASTGAYFVNVFCLKSAQKICNFGGGCHLNNPRREKKPNRQKNKRQNVNLDHRLRARTYTTSCLLILRAYSNPYKYGLPKKMHPFSLLESLREQQKKPRKTNHFYWTALGPSI